MTPAITQRSSSLLYAPEAVEVTRKKALLRLLAVREAERNGLRLGGAEERAYAERFRQAAGLSDEAELDLWLDSVALSRERFGELLRECAIIVELERELAPQIDVRVREQNALWTVHYWAARRGSP
jgi:hypothetical protein